jgi:hypothetical protein
MTESEAPQMRRLARLLFIILFVSAGAVGTLVLAMYVVNLTDPVAQEYREFERRFSAVTLGDSREKVFDRLGKPDDVDGDFRLGQIEGHEDAYERARNSGAIEYSFWFRGIDVVFAIGFDETNKVTLTEFGGT